jgi:hypothetical protein
MDCSSGRAETSGYDAGIRRLISALRSDKGRRDESPGYPTDRNFTSVSCESIDVV